MILFAPIIVSGRDTIMNIVIDPSLAPNNNINHQLSLIIK